MMPLSDTSPNFLSLFRSANVIYGSAVILDDCKIRQEILEVQDLLDRIIQVSGDSILTLKCCPADVTIIFGLPVEICRKFLPYCLENCEGIWEDKGGSELVWVN